MISWFKRLVSPTPSIDTELMESLGRAMMAFDTQRITELTAELLEQFASHAHREMLHDANSARRRVLVRMGSAELADAIYADCIDPLWHAEQEPFPPDLFEPMAAACKRYAEKAVSGN